MRELLAAAHGVYTELKNLCIWNKTNGGMGSLYRSRHELVFVFKNGKDAHLNNVQLGRFGRNRTNVWNYAGANSFARKGQRRALELHPTAKPIAMVIRSACRLRRTIQHATIPIATSVAPYAFLNSCLS